MKGKVMTPRAVADLYYELPGRVVSIAFSMDLYDENTRGIETGKFSQVTLQGIGGVKKSCSSVIEMTGYPVRKTKSGTF